MKPRATLRDIARETGLSVMTISNYINGATLRPENAELIKQAMEKLEYSPNAMAKGLRLNRSMTVGAMISYLNEPFSSTILMGAERVLAEAGYGMIVSDYNNDPQMLGKQSEFLLSKQVDGIIVIPPDDVSSLVNAIGSRVPYVMVEGDMDELACDVVYGENDIACEEMICRAARMGHRHIGVIAGRETALVSNQSLAGCRRAVEAEGIRLDVAHGNFQMQDAYQAACKLLDQPERPTALMALSFVMMTGTLWAVRERNLRIGEDISLIGRDMNYLLDIVVPRIETVDQQMEKTGEEAARLLLARMQNEDEKYDYQRVLVPLTHLPGASLVPPGPWHKMKKEDC